MLKAKRMGYGLNVKGTGRNVHVVGPEKGAVIQGNLAGGERMTKRCGDTREGETSAGSFRGIDSIRMML